VNIERLVKLPPQQFGSETSEQECVDVLLNNVPQRGGIIGRESLERIIRTAFRAGWMMAVFPAARPDNSIDGQVH
jgi:hypothetical protein